jgi:hypothetical protein
VTHAVPDSQIISAFFWPDTKPKIAWKLGVSARHIDRVWLKAKQDGDLPRVKRPPGGFKERPAA